MSSRKARNQLRPGAASRQARAKRTAAASARRKKQTQPERIFSDAVMSPADELRLLHQMMNNCQEEILILKKDSQIVFANALAAERLGYSASYLRRKKLIDFWEHKISQKYWREHYLSQVKKNRPPATFLMNRTTRKGNVHTMELRVARFPYTGGEFFIAIGKNITHQIDLLKTLRESESFYRQVCEQSADAICTLSLDGKIVYANKAAEHMVKARLSKDRTTHFSKYVEADSVAKLNGLLKQIKAGEKVVFEKANIVDTHGNVITIEITGFPTFKNDKVHQVHCIFRDIGKRIQFENLKLESQKMKAVQLFISGTTYEIQNPLMGLLSRVESLLEKYGDRNFEYIGFKEFKNIFQTLDTMRDQIKYCCDTNQRLINISKRKVKLQQSRCDVNAVVRDTIKMFEHELKVMDVTLKTKLGRHLPKAQISRIDLNQIIVNIFTNAIQSMLSGHQITVKTRYVKAARRILIQCRDEGIGISKDVMPHIYEPFFSTKQRGLKKNAGLGLSIVYSIVNAAKGKIRVTSKVNSGTVVRVEIPAVHAK
jgi:PAS domain S-box-containing protein